MHAGVGFSGALLQLDHPVAPGGECPVLTAARGREFLPPTVLDLDTITDFLKTKDQIPVQDFIVSPNHK